MELEGGSFQIMFLGLFSCPASFNVHLKARVLTVAVNA